MDGKKLSVGQKLGFGIFDLGGNLFFTLMGFWCLKYLTDVAGLAAALAGTAVMVSKAWDAVTDPLMGYISDRTLSPLGRRRPYILAGALPMMLCLWLFFTAPGIQNQIVLALWAGGTLMLVNTAATVINIPYSSLTPELTDDYHERTSLNGYRFGCAVFGTILGAAAVLPLAGAFSGGSGGEKAGWSMMGLILGAVIMVVSLLTFLGTRERPHTRADLPTRGFFATYRVVFTNRPYVILFVTYALHLMAITFLQTILSYYTGYLYPERFVLLLRDFPLIGNPAATVPALRETLTTLSMMMLLLTAMVFIPVSVGVSRLIGKKRTYQICFVVIGAACALVAGAGHLLPPGRFLALMVFAGLGVGFSYVAPFAMVPDAVEYDAVLTGERKEGAYYGMWTFISKTGSALAVFLSGQILDWGGYRANAVQGEGAKLAIRLLIGPIPALIFLGALILVQFYPLDEKTYRALTTGKPD
ncbi:MAG: MFS transporter [Treponema sp.]|jgi:GPH family glycoside/pentoside/hexuronide:cation symporter|nr:MFS transporter [Treponema sp.]